MKSFAEINTDDLGGNLVFLSLEGALMHERLSPFEQAAVEKIEKLKKNNTLYWVARSHARQRNRDIATLTKVDYLKSDFLKINEKIRTMVKKSKKPMVIIGDNFLMDGMFAKRIGARFIKVKRRGSYRDGVVFEWIDWVDTFVFNLFS